MPALQRELLRQLRSARSSLLGRLPPPETAIHAARQRIKRARAMLRLLRPALGEARYRRENLWLRDTNRLLSVQRDEVALAGVLDAITRREPALLVAVARFERDWRQSLGRQRTRRRTGAHRQQAAVRLTRAIDRLRRLKLPEPATRLEEQALRRLYRRARRAFGAAADSPGDQSWHECRKQTKYLQSALRLQRRRSARYQHAARRARRLGRLLGEDHDLALLERALLRCAAEILPAGRQLGVYARGERRRLQRQAAVLGSQLYRRSPSSFVT